MSNASSMNRPVCSVESISRLRNRRAGGEKRLREVHCLFQSMGSIRTQMDQGIATLVECLELSVVQVRVYAYPFLDRGKTGRQQILQIIDEGSNRPVAGDDQTAVGGVGGKGSEQFECADEPFVR